MRFLDLDLDFFLNDNAYCNGCDSGRLSSRYKPWSASQVRHFLEERCGLSAGTPVQGRTMESHDEVLDFWRTLIESGSLGVPFDVIHIDAHPDLWAGDGLYLISEVLHVNSKLVLAMLSRKQIHSGNYLTFAIAYGWIASLVWVPLRKHLESASKWDGDARSGLRQFRRKGAYTNQDSPVTERYPGIPFKIVPRRAFRTNELFDYIALSRSPSFTSAESDKLIPVIESYMRQI